MYIIGNTINAILRKISIFVFDIESRKMFIAYHDACCKHKKMLDELGLEHKTNYN